MTNIEQCRTANPRMFWNLLKNLGPKRVNTDIIPIQAKTVSGNNTCVAFEVLNIWKETFRSLFSCKHKNEHTLLLSKHNFYNCLSEMNNSFMNEQIWIYEVEFALKRAKLNKAVGI